MARYFVWQSPWPQKTYHHAKMQALYERELKEWHDNRTLPGFMRNTDRKVYYFWLVYLNPPLWFVFIALPWAARDRRMRVPWMIAIIFALGIEVETWFWLHYTAPVTALVFLFVLQCMRHAHVFRWRGQPVGLVFVRAVTVVYIATAALQIGLEVTHIEPDTDFQHGDIERAAVAQELKSLPWQQLVLVSYPPDSEPDREWVYNSADIDASKVVWARDMGPTENQELLNYYAGRQFWIVQVGPSPPVLQPYQH